MGLIAFVIGLIATAQGLKHALDFGAPVVASLGVAAAALSMGASGRRQMRASGPLRTGRVA
jgi:hypothetical protein